MNADFNWTHDVSNPAYAMPSKYLEAVARALGQLRMIKKEANIANTSGTTDVGRQKFIQSIETRCDIALEKLESSSK